MHTLIVTTDFSKSAMNASRYAAGLARALHVRRIVLYHSYDNAPKETDIPVSEEDSSLAHESSVFALEIVEKDLREILGDHQSVDIQLITNSIPLELAIETLVEQHKAQLVIVGATGESGLSKFLMGSNTLRLAASCPVPLLIVPRETSFQAIEKIVFACDLKHVRRTTPVTEIGWWLDQFKAKLVVLNITREEMLRNKNARAQNLAIRELLDSYNPEYHEEQGPDIVEEIIDFVDEVNAGLVITVPKPYSLFEGLFHRNVSKSLDAKTEVPLLLLKQKE